MINALFLSKLNGTKQFRRGDKCTFGWQTIMDLYKRELARVSQNCIRMVPHLKEANCLRDAWTKLNVHPAKIMQVSSKKYNLIQLFNMIYILARTGLGGALLVHPTGSTT